MLKQERHLLILQLVAEHNFVSLQDLMDATSSSESTIRGDLVELSHDNKLIRLRGGAQALNVDSLSYEMTVETKMGLQVESKKAMADYAVKLIPGQSVIYIDAGTSTYYLADCLRAKGVTIMTNSMTIARLLSTHGHRVYLTGGEFKHTTDAFIGQMTREIVSRFNFDLGFFGTNGVDLKSGLTTPDYEEAVVKRAAIAQCKKAYFLADHTKFGCKSAVVFHEFHGEEIITDQIVLKEYEDQNITEVMKR